MEVEEVTRRTRRTRRTQCSAVHASSECRLYVAGRSIHKPLETETDNKAAAGALARRPRGQQPGQKGDTASFSWVAMVSIGAGPNNMVDFQSYAGPGDRGLRNTELEGYQPVSRIGEVVMNAFGNNARR